jgi:glycosyltransferase involved in cell wall biosynthesis
MILFANFDRAHAYETVQGLVRTQRPVKYLAGSYHLFDSLFGRFVNNLGLPINPLPKELQAIKGIQVRPFSRRNRLCIQNIARSSTVHEQFDQWVANQIRTSVSSIDAFYCYQDYLPRAVATACEKGIPVICEQIIDNSPIVQERLRSEMQRTGTFFTLKDETENRTVLSHASAIIVPTDPISKYAREYGAGNPVFLAPYGVSAQPITTDKCPQGHTDEYIIVRANSVRKGSLIILDALKLLINSSRWPLTLRLVFAGAFDSNSIDAANSLVKLGARIMARNFRHRELMAILPSARAFLMPSLQESLSLLALEAASYGVPLLLSTHVGLEEMDFGHQAIFVRDDTPEAWAAILESLVAGRLRMKELSLGALEIAKQNPWSRYHSTVADSTLAAMGGAYSSRLPPKQFESLA